MRTAPEIMALWNAGGPFIGDSGAPHGRVTVEESFVLTATGKHVGNYSRGPVRWFQRADNSQVETEVPNIKSIQIDRGIDTDAATCTIILQNQLMLDNGETPFDVNELGQPGYYTWGRGNTVESHDRWGHFVNDWNDIIVPNALLRTYQGYGGKTKSIDDAIDDGNIIQSGLWLVDTVSPGTTGDLTITCRDVGKLLIDQSLYPPLVPLDQYRPIGLYYYRFKDENHPVIPYGTTVYGTAYTGVPAGETSTSAPSVVVESASSAHSGYPASNACDFGDPVSFWMSEGHTTSASTADMEYIQFKPAVGTTMTMGAYDLFPWGGAYHYYVSVMVGGVWKGSNTIPYTGSTPGMAIPYVQQVTAVGWEYASLHGLAGGPYAGAQRIRLTFTNLAHSSIGPQFYRAGVRDFSVGVFGQTVTGGGRTIQGIVRSEDDANDGYTLVGTDGGVFTFGDANFYGSEAGIVLNQPICSIAGTADNTGYWLAAKDGGVFAYNKAHFYGSLPGLSISVTNIIDIERSEGGAGYYMVGATGSVYAIGDATYGGNFSGGGTVVSMAVRPQGGYYVVNSLGLVQAFGAASHHGDAHLLTLAQPITGIATTTTGAGYWLVGKDGGVFAYGDAVFHDSLIGIALADPISDIEGFTDDGGYWLVGEDGGVFSLPRGSTSSEDNFWGSLPQSFDFEVAGNYSDWVDIIRDLLLWSGFWLEETLTSTQAPSVFGNLESTGAFALDNITEDFFDKKPVIDVIHAIREIVGYAVYVDDQGGFHFHPPNIWSIGNYLEDGTPTSTVPVIDEALQITQYQVAYGDADARTSITVSSSDPIQPLKDTVTVTRQSTTGQALLKGIVRNALWINGQFTNKLEAAVLAELIDLTLYLAERQGSVVMAANPAISINDQVRIFERQTGETYIHYVNAVSSSMDLVSGVYTMTLTTHWLGDGNEWFLAYNAPDTTTGPFPLSPLLQSYLKTLPSRVLQDVYPIQDFNDPNYPQPRVGAGDNKSTSILFSKSDGHDYQLFVGDNDLSTEVQLSVH